TGVLPFAAGFLILAVILISSDYGPGAVTFTISVRSPSWRRRRRGTRRADPDACRQVSRPARGDSGQPGSARFIRLTLTMQSRRNSAVDSGKLRFCRRKLSRQVQESIRNQSVDPYLAKPADSGIWPHFGVPERGR